MSELEGLMRRVNDTVVQTRCDRRSLATILMFMRSKGVYVGSLSSLTRMIIEQMNRIVVDVEGGEEVLSTIDASEILRDLGRASLNPGGRGMFTHVQQMQKEELFLEYGNANYMESTKAKRSKKLKNKSSEEYSKKSIQSEATQMWKTEMQKQEREDIEQAQKRREEETQDMKTGLRQVPDNVVRDEE